MRRIIVTGGSGFIGWHLANHLSRQADTQVTIIDNHSRGAADEMFAELAARKNVIFLNEDMTQKNFYGKLSGRYDEIYHLAAINGTKNFYERPYEVLRVNILSLMNILEWCTVENCGAFLFSSSSEAYAGTVNRFNTAGEFIPSAEDIPLSVEDVMNPRWSYGGSKLAGELLTINYCRTRGVPFKIVRYHNIYGARMGFDHVLPEFFKRVHDRVNPFPIFGGQETRAFCAVEDAVRATQAVMLSDKCNGEIIHVGNSSQEIKIIDLLALVFDVTNFHPRVDIRPAPAGSVARRCPSTRKLFSLTVFEARITLEKALPEMYSWYEKKYRELEEVQKC